MKRATAILVSDIHLREDTPTCRLDSFWEAQWRKLDYISALAEELDCPVVHGGDLFHHWKPSPYLLSMTIQHLPRQFWTVYGNHDLPQHNLDLVEKCGLNVLEAAGRIRVLPGTHFGQKPAGASFIIGGRKVLVWHVMTWAGSLPYPDCPDPGAHILLKNWPDYDLILTGDNHQTFVAKFKGRVLVNPGSMSRQTAAQEHHRPCVFIWYADTNEVEEVALPIDDDVVSRDHIIRKQERDGRLHAFISRLDNDWKASVSFEDNVEQLLAKNQIRTSVAKIVKSVVYETN